MRMTCVERSAELNFAVYTFQRQAQHSGNARDAVIGAERMQLRAAQEILAMNAGRSRALVLRDVIEIADFKNIPDPNARETFDQQIANEKIPAFLK